MLAFQRDLSADFRRFYGLSPTEALALPAPEYLALAYRVDVYGGVIAMRRTQQHEKAQADCADVPLQTLADVIDFG